MYLALYRKYRPRTFADVISQQHITTTLTNQLKTGQVAHAYLFTGSRGTGKTTCAKILAKAVNCEHLVDGNPCLECDTCKLIDEGTSDIYEIDAASNNGVDDVRALRDEVMYSPINCKYRVYIIDEVHMLSIQAFNALLKTIEEPPPHVVFILATTESHKVPATILSRCQRFEFHRIDIEDSAKRLLWIAEEEHITLENDAAFLISRLSDGGMRDALSLLDQCISVSEKVTVQVVKECAGVAGKEHLFAVTDAILAKDTPKALQIVDDLYQQSKELSRLCEELIEHYRTLMLLSVTPDSKLIRALPDELAQYKAQAEGYTLEMIMRCLDILTSCLEQMKRSQQRKILAEMTIIKLCTPKLDTDTKALSLRMDNLEAYVKKAVNGQIPASPAYEYKVMAEQKPVAEAVPEQIPEPAPEISPKQDTIINDTEEIPLPSENDIPVPFEQTAEIPVEQPVPVTSVSEPTQTDNLQRVAEWADVIDKLPIYLSGLIDGSEAFYSGNTILVKGSPSVKSLLSDKDHSAKLSRAITDVLGKNYPITLSEDISVTEQEDKTIENFLAFAKEQGVAIKKKNN